MWHSSPMRLNRCPLHWEPGVLTTGPPGKSQISGFRMPSHHPSFSWTPSTFCPAFLSFPLNICCWPSQFPSFLNNAVSVTAGISLHIPFTVSRGDDPSNLPFKLLFVTGILLKGKWGKNGQKIGKL